MSASLSRASASLCLAGALCLLPGVASAQRTTAEEYYRRGTQLFGQRAFGDAAREFQRAYEVSRRPELLFNLGRAFEEDGQLEAARDAYRRCDKAMPGDFDRVPLRARLAAVEARLEARRPQPVAPPIAHPVAPPSVESRPRPRVMTRTVYGPSPAATVLMIGGGAALVTGAVLGALGQSALEGCRVEGDVARCQNQSALDRARTSPDLFTGANVAFVLGGVALVVGVTLWVLSPSRRVNVALGPGSIALHARW